MTKSHGPMLSIAKACTTCLLAALVLTTTAQSIRAENEGIHKDGAVNSPQEEFVWRGTGRGRDEALPYFSLDGLFTALSEGEALIITRYQDQIVIRKVGSRSSPYPGISEAVRPERK